MKQPRLTALDHLVLTVINIDATISFYCDVLGMEHAPLTAADGTIRHALRFGDQKINLHKAGQAFTPKAAVPASGSADLCFLTQTPIEDWQSHLQSAGVEIEDGPVERSGAIGPILSLYMRDPDGNLIEVSIENCNV